ncbi:Formate dehydrogenase -O gamma subunit [Paramagnetospirillum magnetotacticum MS-1]|uniref:Formate dehydrogenase-O gamma subunit n=1 Tax=Paramagnetospirillum magnetotacticum MS-1 TaxID=272627 RepID=A0A0C2UB03_PARME|nr:formate dehydrogenase subunit gamma [Paramagnetospirillum magnetotacticum]KIL98657.1 Formate dehydrogenase -O gamma subunit [Paramagnetospirillum magnetotacticum MS-1]
MSRTILAILAIVLGLGVTEPAWAASSDGDIPTAAQSDRVTSPDSWRAIRQGEAGYIGGQPATRGVLIQSEGETWRNVRNGKLAVYAGWLLIGVTLAITAFYFIRGKIMMEGGPSGQTILRFTKIERIGHWLTAGSFLVLGATGLNLLFGRWIIEPIIGKTLFSWLSWAGKWLHNISGFVFMAGLVVIFYLWARDNLWDRYDWGWIKGGGGLLKKGVHPPAAKFNFGQKTQFWMVIVVGALVSSTGLNLLFPFTLADLHAMQVMHLIHAALAVVMILFILGHIYIGTIGMEGASTAVTTGYVDREWAREHHAVWVEEVEKGEPKAAE